MKKHLTLAIVLLCTFFMYVNAQTNRMIANYETSELLFTIWGGSGSMEVVANPDPSGANTSAACGVSYWGGQTFGIESHQLINKDSLAWPIDFAATPYAMIKVWSAKPVLFEFQFQKYSDWTISEVRNYQLTADQTSKWIDLAFDFSGVTKTLDRVVFFIDRAALVSVNGDECFFDAIRVSNNPSWDPNAVKNPVTSSLSIYPNPVSDNLTLNLPDEQGPFAIQIYNALGKVAYQTNALKKGKVEINGSSLKSGMYLVKVTSEKGNVFTEKMLKK